MNKFEVDVTLHAAQMQNDCLSKIVIASDAMNTMNVGFFTALALRSE